MDADVRPTVVSFESRLADETRNMLEKNGWNAVSAPSMREVPLDEHTEVFTFADQLVGGETDVLILLTGVGTRMMINTMCTRFDEADVIRALERVYIVARGPKPVRALRERGLSPDLKVPEPNTWRELLAAVDGAAAIQPLEGKRIGVQEYGVSNQELIEGLRRRGASVQAVPIYRWQLPEDRGPLEDGIRRIIEGRAQAAIFTSRTQVDHMIQVAEEMGLRDALVAALRKVTVGSVGPICTEGLRDYGLEPDFEPDSPKLGALIRDLTRRMNRAE